DNTAADDRPQTGRRAFAQIREHRYAGPRVRRPGRDALVGCLYYEIRIALPDRVRRGGAGREHPGIIDPGRPPTAPRVRLERRPYGDPLGRLVMERGRAHGLPTTQLRHRRIRSEREYD